METKIKPEKFLFQLTTEEFNALFCGILQNILPSLIKEGIKEHLKGITVDLPDIIDIHETSKITGLKLKSIYSKVSRLELPSITRGRPLMFSRVEIEKWMKSGRPSVAEIALKTYVNTMKNKG